MRIPGGSKNKAASLRQQDQFIFLHDLTAYCQNVRHLFRIRKPLSDDDVMNMHIPVFRGVGLNSETEKVHRMDVRAPRTQNLI